jgi:alpha-L-rhamnosidase
MTAYLPNLRRVRLPGTALLAVVAGLCFGQAWRAAVTVVETCCEYAVNPLGLDIPQPRFTWVLQSDRRGTMQQAYQVLVAGSKRK